MSVGSIVLLISFAILLGLGIDVISDPGKVHLQLIALSFIPLGILLNGWVVPLTFVRRE